VDHGAEHTGRWRYHHQGRVGSSNRALRRPLGRGKAAQRKPAKAPNELFAIDQQPRRLFA
jgi:hypothetical protein